MLKLRYLFIALVALQVALQISGNMCDVKCTPECQSKTQCTPTCTEMCLDDTIAQSAEELESCLDKKCSRVCTSADMTVDYSTCEYRPNPKDGAVANEKWKKQRYAEIIRSFIPYGCKVSPAFPLQKVELETCDHPADVPSSNNDSNSNSSGGSSKSSNTNTDNGKDKDTDTSASSDDETSSISSIIYFFIGCAVGIVGTAIPVFLCVKCRKNKQQAQDPIAKSIASNGSAETVLQVESEGTYNASLTPRCV